MTDAIALYRAERAKRGRPVLGGGTLSDRDAKMAAAYRNGDTVRMIAERFACSQQTVCRALRRRGAMARVRRGDDGPTHPRTVGRLTLKQQLRVALRRIKTLEAKLAARAA